MSLHRKLLAVLLALVALGLAAFSVVSYQLYSRIQYNQLNSQLHSASPLLAQFVGRNYRPGFRVALPAGDQARPATGFSAVLPGPVLPEAFLPRAIRPGAIQRRAATPPSQASQPSQPQPSQTQPSQPQLAQTQASQPAAGRLANRLAGPNNLPEGSYVELRSAAGVVLANSQIKVGCYTSDPQCPQAPELPKVLRPGRGGTERMFNDGSDQFRVLVRSLGPPTDRPVAFGPFRGDLLVTAVPLAGIHRSLHHLIVLYLSVGAAVLVALSLAVLFLLRRGLAPLERIAGTARAIAAGDFTQRVPDADPRTEVGQLGLAFNTMMSRIERAFTERDATEGRLRQFLADASHELRTPLTSIRGYAELWKMGAASSGQELQTAMLRIEQHAREMSTLVEELLLLARLDQPRSPEREPVDLTVLAAESLGDVAVTATDRRFAFDAPEPAAVVGDALHLRQAINNLLVNAVRHTPAGRPIELGVHAEGPDVVLRVRDRGPGLSPEGLDRAFDRFWRADWSRGTEGNGLGLAIVAAVAAEHGGEAAVANHPDGGAVFTLRIPAAPQAVLALGTNPLSLEPESASPVTDRLPEVTDRLPEAVPS